MNSNNTFECFPLRMVAAANVVPLGIYAIGIYLMFRLGLIWGWLYLVFCFFAEIRIMMMSCRYCYYYGKLCGLGRGKLASLFLRKGDPKVFLEKKITWKDLVPDLLVALIPFLAGIYLLIAGYSWKLLILTVLLFILASFGNGFIRGNIVCKYCKQRGFGCPAEKLFRKKN